MGREAISDDRRVRVLVVDDDSDLAESYRHVLELAGYSVSTALSGEAALSSARVQRPEVVLTDVSMPEMDGFELIHRLDQLDGESPAVVVCSAFDITEQEALAQGARVFLRKPASAETLVHSIESIRRGTDPDEDALASERTHVTHERSNNVRGSAERIGEIDRAEIAREAQPWLEWLRRYFDCGSAGMFLLDGSAVRPVLAMGRHLAKRPEPRLLNATLAAGIETGTSLVVADMANHPAFRHTVSPRSQIASFVGVPLITSDGVRVGALCLADSEAGRFDADTLVMLEYLGRRSVSELFEKTGSRGHEPRIAPLLARPTFEVLLSAELKSAGRADHAVETAVGALAPGVSPGACAQDLWRACARARLAIGSMGLGRVGLFVRDAPKDARAFVAECLARARARGLFEAAGIAAVSASTTLSKTAVVELAESALSVAEGATIGPKVERIVVRTDPGRYFA